MYLRRVVFIKLWFRVLPCSSGFPSEKKIDNVFKYDVKMILQNLKNGGFDGEGRIKNSRDVSNSWSFVVIVHAESMWGKVL